MNAYELYERLTKVLDTGHGKREIEICSGRKRFQIIGVTVPKNPDEPVEIDTRQK